MKAAILCTAVLALGCGATTSRTAAPPPPATGADRPVPPRRRPVLAVFDIDATGLQISAALRERLDEYLSVILVESGSFAVVPRSRVKPLLVASKRESYRSCYDQSCQIEIGRELAAHKTLATRVLLLGDACVVVTTLYDLRTATAEAGARHSAPCTLKGITESLGVVVSKLTGHEIKAPSAATAETDEDAPRGGSKRLDCPGCDLDEDPDLSPSARAQKAERQRREAERRRQQELRRRR